MSQSSDSALADYPGGLSSSAGDAIDLVFVCKLEKVQTIASILNAVNISKDKKVMTVRDLQPTNFSLSKVKLILPDMYTHNNQKRNPIYSGRVTLTTSKRFFSGRIIPTICIDRSKHPIQNFPFRIS